MSTQTAPGRQGPPENRVCYGFSGGMPSRTPERERKWKFPIRIHIVHRIAGAEGVGVNAWVFAAQGVGR